MEDIVADAGGIRRSRRVRSTDSLDFSAALIFSYVKEEVEEDEARACTTLFRLRIKKSQRQISIRFPSSFVDRINDF